MPPKKGGKGKDEPAGLTDKELLLRAENELVALMQLLEARTNEVHEARRGERMWREQATALQQAIKDKHEDNLDLVATHRREAEILGDKHRVRVAQLENEVQRLRDMLAAREAEVAGLEQQVEALGAENVKKVNEIHRQMERMRTEFTMMLQDTLEKLNAKLLDPDTSPHGRRAQFLKNKTLDFRDLGLVAPGSREEGNGSGGGAAGASGGAHGGSPAAKGAAGGGSSTRHFGHSATTPAPRTRLL